MEELGELGVELVPVSYKEAEQLGCNVLSAGNRRIAAAAHVGSVNARLERLGYEVAAVKSSNLPKAAEASIA